MSFRENLKLQLSYSDMPVRELAELSGVKKSTIDSYLNNHERMPSAEAAIRLARTLGVSVEHLFGEDDAGDTVRGLSGREKQVQRREEKLATAAQHLAKQMRDFADLLEGFGTGAGSSRC
jgi:transcriptional regulator with XRE-family HTH domain